ncbi:MAG: sugar phosphate isomerase/epimerase [Armatimonadota bacterium]|nr:sugar phosphate isomerase/epimerase [Armatimonadota bacterium]
MSRTVKLELGINGAFITRRWEEPENWMRLTRELGYRNHEFCCDVLDPFFSGDKQYQFKTAETVRRFAEKYGVNITSAYTGVATHRFHGLSHSCPAVRHRMKQWIIEMMDLALAMGTDRVGGHWDAFSIEVLSDPARTDAAVRNLYATFRELAQVGKSKGMAGIYQEQMYIPSEIPWTLDQARDFLINTNKDNDGVPVLITVDVGHQAGQPYGAKGADLDYLEWVRRYAAVSETVHLQQTQPDGSHHWPFTEKYNKIGHIRIDAVIEAIRYSHEHFAESPLSKVMEPVETNYLTLEAIPGSTKCEDVLLQELKESAQYLRRFVPEEGLELRVE